MERIKQWKKQLIGALLTVSLTVPLVLLAISLGGSPPWPSG